MTGLTRNNGWTNSNPSDSERQLRRDRIVAASALVFFAALMALMIWLASLSGGAGGGYDYWMMP